MNLSCEHCGLRSNVFTRQLNGLKNEILDMQDELQLKTRHMQSMKHIHLEANNCFNLFSKIMDLGRVRVKRKEDSGELDGCVAQLEKHFDEFREWETQMEMMNEMRMPHINLERCESDQIVVNMHERRLIRAMVKAKNKENDGSNIKESTSELTPAVPLTEQSSSSSSSTSSSETTKGNEVPSFTSILPHTSQFTSKKTKMSLRLKCPRSKCTFVTKSGVAYLKKHMAKHDEYKFYTCQLCNERFSQIETLTRHKKFCAKATSPTTETRNETDNVTTSIASQAFDPNEKYHLKCIKCNFETFTIHEFTDHIKSHLPNDNEASPISPGAISRNAPNSPMETTGPPVVPSNETHAKQMSVPLMSSIEPCTKKSKLTLSKNESELVHYRMEEENNVDLESTKVASNPPDSRINADIDLLRPFHEDIPQTIEQQSNMNAISFILMHCPHLGCQYIGTQKNLTTHIKHTHGPKKFKCPFRSCLKSYKRETLLNAHIRMKHQIKSTNESFAQNINSIYFASSAPTSTLIPTNTTITAKTQPITDVIQETNDKFLIINEFPPYVCHEDLCDEKFGSKEGLVVHQQSIHNIYWNKYKCPHCCNHYLYDTKADLARHQSLCIGVHNVRENAKLKTNRDEATTHCCTICSKIFSNNQLLNQHIITMHVLTHINSPPIETPSPAAITPSPAQAASLSVFQCNRVNCGRKFINENFLKIHQREEHAFNGQIEETDNGRLR